MQRCKSNLKTSGPTYCFRFTMILIFLLKTLYLFNFLSLVHPHRKCTFCSTGCSLPRHGDTLCKSSVVLSDWPCYSSLKVICEPWDVCVCVWVCVGKVDVRLHTRGYMCTDRTRQGLLLSLSAVLAFSHSLIPQCYSHLWAPSPSELSISRPENLTSWSRLSYCHRFKICIRHIHNYTEYNQHWNVSQVRSMDTVIIWNTNTREYT